MTEHPSFEIKKLKVKQIDKHAIASIIIQFPNQQLTHTFITSNGIWAHIDKMITICVDGSFVCFSRSQLTDNLDAHPKIMHFINIVKQLL